MLETKTAHTKNFSTSSLERSHSQGFYFLSIHICTIAKIRDRKKRLHRLTFFFPLDRNFVENRCQIKKSMNVLLSLVKLDSLSHSLSLLNFSTYVQTHSTSHTHLHSDLTLNAHVDNPQAQPDQRNNTFHGLWCLCIRSGQSTRFLQITFPLCIQWLNTGLNRLSMKWKQGMKTGTRRIPALECKVLCNSFLIIQKKSGGGHGKLCEREIQKMNGSVTDDQQEHQTLQSTVQK